MQRHLLAPIAIVACAFLAGCNGTIGALEPAFSVAGNNSEGEEEATPERRHIGKPYKVGGRWYHPKEDEEYDKKGLASWYGSRFHGRRTASGERFDKNAMTAAHPTLPLPSYVRVTAVDSGKSVVVRVNDRGPFSRGRIIDVSRAAAEELGFRRAGHAEVRVEYLGPAPIDGGAEETLIAAKKYRAKPSAKSSRGSGFLGFGGSGKTTKTAESPKKEKDVEVRLASAEPLTGEEKLPPGVSSRYAPRRRAPVADTQTPATASAYAAEAGGNRAIEAVNAIEEPVKEEKKSIVAQPLPETATTVSSDRFAGAHDMFSSGDGSGISSVISANTAASESETGETADQTAAQ